MNGPWLHNYDDGVPPSLEYPEITLPQFLVDTAARHPDYIVTTFNGMTSPTTAWANRSGEF
jgi:long-chain acyl-CoA synthetase